MSQAAEVQVWGMKPTEQNFVTYDWITIGSIDYHEDMDTELLKQQLRSIVDASENKPFTNACRLKFVSGSKTMTGIF